MIAKEKVKMKLSPDVMQSIEVNKHKMSGSRAEKLTQAMTLASALVDLEAKDEPMLIVFGRLEITNDRFREEKKKAFDEAMDEIAKHDRKLMEIVYEAAQMKPAFFGVGVDLKPIIERLRTCIKRYKE